MKYFACVTYINCGEVEQHGCISAEVGDFPCNPLTNFCFCDALSSILSNILHT